MIAYLARFQMKCSIGFDLKYYAEAGVFASSSLDLPQEFRAGIGTLNMFL